MRVFRSSAEDVHGSRRHQALGLTARVLGRVRSGRWGCAHAGERTSCKSGRREFGCSVGCHGAGGSRGLVATASVDYGAMYGHVRRFLLVRSL